MSGINYVELIERKSHGGSFTNEEIDAIVCGVANGIIDDCQIGALLMAVKLCGMNADETGRLTERMAFQGCSDSGAWLGFNWADKSWSHLVVDKHSTGGVGDKVSLILAPLLAACGLKVPMISGRGLGITGGTIDKLETISGFKSELSPDKLNKTIEDVGLFIVAQTPQMVPVDRKIYKLRDVTATVKSLPLITSSILSKKKVEDVRVLLLDVKHGSGAVNETVEQANKLAESMLNTGKAMGMRIICVIDDMNTVLGRCAGNAIEVAESLQVLNNDNGAGDLREAVLKMGALLLTAVHTEMSEDDARGKLEAALQDGSALEKFRQFILHQEADSKVAAAICQRGTRSISEYMNMMGYGEDNSVVVLDCIAPEDGFITGVRANIVGEVLRDLGAGRSRPGQPVDPAVGLELVASVAVETANKDPLQPVIRGKTVWGRLYCGQFNKKHLAMGDTADILAKLNSALQISAEAPKEAKPKISTVFKNF